MKPFAKKAEVEARIGMTIREYAMSKSGWSQNDMALDLGVQPVTLGRWLQLDGMEKVPTYRPKARVAA